MLRPRLINILGFHVTSRHHKIPHIFGLQKWIELGHVSQVDNFWFSSHNFGEEAVIQTFQPCHPTWPPPYETDLFNFGNTETFQLELLHQN